MASSKVSNPLQPLNRLGPSVYLRDASSVSVSLTPVERQSTPNTSQQSTILLISWTNASPRNIAKYVSGYPALEPEARIILVMTNFTDLLYRTESSLQRRLRLVIEAICADPESPLVVHIFSNGGAVQLCRLAFTFRETTGHLLPLKALILDSTPGKGTFNRVAAALNPSLPKPWYLRLPSLVGVYVLLAVLWSLNAVLGRKDAIENARDGLNDPQLIRKDAVRCYIYSEKDELVWWRDVEDHSRDAESRGLSVKRERFGGSGHVEHMRVDGSRYWKIVARYLESSR